MYFDHLLFLSDSSIIYNSKIYATFSDIPLSNPMEISSSFVKIYVLYSTQLKFPSTWFHRSSNQLSSIEVCFIFLKTAIIIKKAVAIFSKAFIIIKAAISPKASISSKADSIKKAVAIKAEIPTAYQFVAQNPECDYKTSKAMKIVDLSTIFIRRNTSHASPCRPSPGARVEEW